MNKKVYDYLDEISHRSEIISQKRAFIRKKTEEYEKEIAIPTQSITRQQISIKLIRDMDIFAQVGEIANQLANQWGIDAKNINISASTSYTGSTRNKDFAHNFVNKFSRDYLQDSYTVNIDLRENTPNGNEYRFASFHAPIQLNAIQADGKDFFEHLVPKTTLYGHGVYLFDIEIDDVNKLVLPFKMKTLIKQVGNSVTPLNETSKAILDAGEIYRQKQSSEMAD